MAGGDDRSARRNRLATGGPGWSASLLLLTVVVFLARRYAVAEQRA